MKEDSDIWDERYRGTNFPNEPSDIVTRFAELATTGAALDIAAGRGRNSIYLAELGFIVDAVDISSVGLSSIDTQKNHINAIHADLDSYQIFPDRYHLIINLNFLQRKLFQPIINGLTHGGLLIFQTFLDEEKPFGGVENDNSRYLAPNELLIAFSPLRILYYDETRVKDWNHKTRLLASLVARKPVDEFFSSQSAR